MNTPVERVLANLPDARKAGAGWVARCPAHDDRSPSLSVSEGDDGRALIRCHAGCEPGEVCEAMGLTLRDLMPDTGPTPTPRKELAKRAGKTFASASAAVADLEQRHGKRSALWTYQDAEGKPVALVVRWDRPDGKKDIRPVSRHADGWRLEGMPTPRPLYRLPELADAARVVVVEGEKCADAAHALGYTATTSAHGSQSPGKTDWSPLAGKEVWLLPDNDEPGRKYASAVAGILAKLSPAPRVCVVNLPGLGEGGDLVDWLAARADGADPEQLRAELEALADESREATTDTPDDAPEPAKERFGFIEAGAFLATDYTQSFLIRNVLVASQPAVIAGPSKAMKTSLTVDMAVSLAAGVPFLGKFEVPRRARVAVVSGESGQATLKETALRVIGSKGLDPPAVAQRLHFCFDLPQFRDVPDMTAFAERLARLNIEVAIIDPVYLCLGAGMDAANLFEMGAAFRVVSDVLLKARVTPALVHHANRQLKPGEPMEIQHLAYSGLEQFARQFVMLNRQATYKGDGVHDLWLSAGGSAGHGGLWSLHIEEGTVDEYFRGRVWNVEVQTPGEAKAEQMNRREAEKDERGRQRMQQEETDLLHAIDTAATDGRPATKTFIRERFPRLKGTVLEDTAARLIRSGEIEPFESESPGGNRARQKVTAYRRRSGESER